MFKGKMYRNFICSIWSRASTFAVFSDQVHVICPCSCFDYPRNYCFKVVTGGEDMKIVVIKSPKLLSSILRTVFKIDKENNN